MTVADYITKLTLEAHKAGAYQVNVWSSFDLDKEMPKTFSTTYVMRDRNKLYITLGEVSKS